MNAQSDAGISEIVPGEQHFLNPLPISAPLLDLVEVAIASFILLKHDDLIRIINNEIGLDAANWLRHPVR